MSYTATNHWGGGFNVFLSLASHSLLNPENLGKEVSLALSALKWSNSEKNELIVGLRLMFFNDLNSESGFSVTNGPLSVSSVPQEGILVGPRSEPL